MILSKNRLFQKLSKYKGITINDFIEDVNYYKIVLKIFCTSQIEDARFYLDYEIVIEFPHDYPKELPICYENGEKKISHYHHLNPGKQRTFCLGTEMELRYRLMPEYTAEKYIELIIEYLTIYEYYKKYHTMPVIDRGHGEIGIIEGYQSLFKVSNKAKVLNLLHSLPVKNKYKNLSCPCGSEKKLKNCHYNHLKKISNSKLLYKQAIIDLEFIEN